MMQPTAIATSAGRRDAGRRRLDLSGADPGRVVRAGRVLLGEQRPQHQVDEHADPVGQGQHHRRDPHDERVDAEPPGEAGAHAADAAPVAPAHEAGGKAGERWSGRGGHVRVHDGARRRRRASGTA